MSVTDRLKAILKDSSFISKIPFDHWKAGWTCLLFLLVCSQQKWGGKGYHSYNFFFPFFFSFFLKDSFVPPPAAGLEKVTKDQGREKRLVTFVFSAWQAVATQEFSLEIGESRYQPYSCSLTALLRLRYCCLCSSGLGVKALLDLNWL